MRLGDFPPSSNATRFTPAAAFFDTYQTHHKTTQSPNCSKESSPARAEAVQVEVDTLYDFERIKTEAIPISDKHSS